MIVTEAYNKRVVQGFIFPTLLNGIKCLLTFLLGLYDYCEKFKLLPIYSNFHKLNILTWQGNVYKNFINFDSKLFELFSKFSEILNKSREEIITKEQALEIYDSILVINISF